MAKSKLIGVRALRANIADLVAGVTLVQGSRAPVVVRAHQMITQTLGEAAEIVKTTGQLNARALGWPERVVKAFFKFSDPVGIRPDRMTALVGVRTGAPTARGKKDSSIYKEWHAGKSSNPKAKAAPGTKIGMSLAAMWEMGTSRMAAKPAFRPALESTRKAVLDSLRKGYKRVIVELDWNTHKATE